MASNYQTPQQQVAYSQQRKVQQAAVNREKKVFAANLEAIASGEVDWLELQAKLDQTFDPNSAA